MKALFLDCFSGISGDMLLGALLDLGADKDLLQSELDKLNLAGYEILVEKKLINTITGTDFRVRINEGYEAYKSRIAMAQLHANSHTHITHHRNLKDIKEMILQSELSPKVKEMSIAVFEEIARAEAKVHAKEVSEIHFHEVGAIDSIIDIVGVAVCLEMLDIARIYSSQLHDGRGFIESQHGTIPVPVPAVIEMLRGSGIPYVLEDIPTELVTPTGMGIVKTISYAFGGMPAFNIEKIGYGMGKRHTGKFNALRAILGDIPETDIISGDLELEEIVILETNIDNMNPEIVGFVQEKLLAIGALDVYMTPIYMKKNRPAFILTVLCNKKDEKDMIDILLKETTTLGIRRTLTSRYCMKREISEVETPYGNIRVKVASFGDFKKVAPEFEDVRKISLEKNLPFNVIYQCVLDKAGDKAGDIRKK